LTALHAVAAVFFVSDVVADFMYEGRSFHNVLEAVVCASLVAGVMLGAVEIRRLLVQARRTEAALSVARGALGELIEDRFKTWRLTPAEVDVALLALKGFDIARIAELRGAASGTVRAQLARIYGKAGVSSHVELLSTFIDDLLGSPVALPRALPAKSTKTAAQDRVSAEG
jgi:DNA-binding CsgD family transcriptional regulator